MHFRLKIMEQLSCCFRMCLRKGLLPMSHLQRKFIIAQFSTLVKTMNAYPKFIGLNARTPAVRAMTLTTSSADDIEQNTVAEDVIKTVNKQIKSQSHGRLFAVVHIAGRQFKVTNEDLIMFPTNNTFPDVGERIRLEKVLLVGGADFSLVGRPLLKNVIVEATVIEKTLSYAKAWYFYKRRKNYRKFRLYQDFLTVLRINSIELQPVDDSVD